MDGENSRKGGGKKEEESEMRRRKERGRSRTEGQGDFGKRIGSRVLAEKLFGAPYSADIFDAFFAVLLEAVFGEGEKAGENRFSELSVGRRKGGSDTLAEQWAEDDGEISRERKLRERLGR